MRVLMFGWEFPPHVSGGLGAACEGMVKSLVAKGTQVVFVMPRLVDSPEKTPLPKGLQMESASGVWLPELEGYSSRLQRETKEFWHKNLSVERIDSALIPYTTPQSYEAIREEYLRKVQSSEQWASEAQIKGPGYKVELKGGYGKDLLSEVYRYSLAAKVIAGRNDFDVIHAHDWMTYPAGALAKQESGKPLVIHVHATEADRSGLNVNQQVFRIEKEGMMAADRVVAVSHFTKDLLMRVYGVPEGKIDVVHNAVAKRDAKSIYHAVQKGPEKQVLFMGRVTFQKGPDYFVEAARLVLNVMPDVRFVMAGSGDMLRSMIRRVARYRMGRRFSFTGFLRGNDVDRMYASSDLYVMPSVSEPFGIAPLEAMVYDVPVLMSKQSGVSEVIQNALKVDFWDVRKMASSICAILSYPALARHLSKNCRDELKNIKWDNAADKLNLIYKSLIS